MTEELSPDKCSSCGGPLEPGLFMIDHTRDVLPALAIFSSFIDDRRYHCFLCHAKWATAVQGIKMGVLVVTNLRMEEDYNLKFDVVRRDQDASL